MTQPSDAPTLSPDGQRRPSRIATIRDVARAANVSVSTVSHVLSGKRPTSPQTQQRVREEVERLGYRPNAVAQSLVWRRGFALGLVIPDIANPYFPTFARGVEDLVRAQGYILMLGNSAYDAERELSYLDLLRARELAGAIFCLSDERSPVRPQLLAAAADGYPVVLIHRPLPGVSTVSADNRGGGQLAARHLLELGHTHVGVVGGQQEDEGMQDRLRGFQQVFQTVSPSLPAASAEPQIEGGRRAGEQLLRQHPELTAIFALNDLLALGVLEAARALGRHVPADLSVVGFDDIAFAALANPPLTTIAQPIRELGERAADLLLRQVEAGPGHAPAGPPVVVELPSKLVVRGSTAAPGASA